MEIIGLNLYGNVLQSAGYNCVSLLPCQFESDCQYLGVSVQIIVQKWPKTFLNAVV